MEFQSSSHSIVEEKDSFEASQLGRSHSFTLPFDILGLIFHHVAAGYPVHLSSLLFVCRSWHDAVCLHPTLWATIRVDRTLLTIFAPKGAFRKLLIKHYIHSCLRRSGTVSLDVSVDLHPHQLSSFTSQNGLLETWSYLFFLVTDLIGPGGEHARRWRSFTWWCHRLDFTSRIFSKFPLILPVLEILRLRGVRLDASHIGAFPRCPRLHIVELHQFAVHPLKNEDCLLVSDLFITTEIVWLSLDLIVLSQFPRIRQLTLHTTLKGRALFILDRDDPPLNEVMLPRLQCLQLRGDVPSQVVGGLVVPSLKDLALDSYTSLEILGDLSLTRTVETVHIAIPNLDPYLLPKQVEKLLEAAPALKQLCAPKWFHNWLDKSKFHLGADILVVVEWNHIGDDAPLSLMAYTLLSSKTAGVQIKVILLRLSCLFRLPLVQQPLQHEQSNTNLSGA